ncbi:hypothetical protein ACFL20_06030 [Spirochaetota bacterium]
MLKTLPFYIKTFIIISIVSIITITYSTTYTDENSFKSSLLDFVNKTSIPDKTNIEIIGTPMVSENGIYPSSLYKKGDWGKYIFGPEYRYIDKYEKLSLYSNENVNIISYGSIKLNLKYGGSVFLDKKYKQYDEDKAVSKVIQSGFIPEQEMQVHMEGKIGKRMTIYIDHDSRKKVGNRYLMQYRAVKDDEIIREINAGEIDVKFNHSKYGVYDNTSNKALGIDLTLKKSKLKVKAFGSIALGETETERFVGNSSPGDTKLSEFQYIKRVYYQIEPFKRYDNRSVIPSEIEIASSNVMNSTPSSPDSYILYPVNLNPSDFELYMDDQNPYNNYNAITLSIDNGNYVKLVSGRDYSINYTTGLITFLKDIPENSRIFAAYTLKSGNTVDPQSLSPGDIKHPGGRFSGKIFTFIKYGYSISEDSNATDRNNDGKYNRDIYEVRSFYYLGERNILNKNFKIKFLNDNRVMDKAEVSSMGRYAIDYKVGVIQFTYREPFKALNPSVYSERQPSDIYISSRYSIRADYFREARSFQLKHVNIIPNSVRIKVNGRVLPTSLYSIDYISGFLAFTNATNPLIGPETVIEVKYEFYPFGAQPQSFIGGLRADYRFNRNLNIGGSLLFSRSAGTEKIPDPDNVPTQTMLFEGDALVHLDGKRLAQFVNLFSKKKRNSIPVEINAYGEYARSYKNVNTFGRALIDNMESSDEIVSISLSDKDWILASMPGGTAQNERGILNYHYYRDPSNPETLKGISYEATQVNNTVKQGPYNIATGSVSSSIQEYKNQLSLVLNMNFTSGNYVSIATRNLSKTAVDFSGIQYVEISYRYEGDAEIDLFFDLGRLNEDSDGDGQFDTEDTNKNGHIDYDPGTVISEDMGYEFNSAAFTTVVGSGPGLNRVTMGDGMLNSEDLNHNGVFEDDSVLGYQYERVYSLPGVNTSPTGFNITSADSAWTKKRIYINQSGFTQAQVDVLKQVEALRLYIRNNSGTAGTLYIDKIRFVSSRWRNIERDGITAGPDDLSATMINSINDDDYRTESFLFSKKDLYESLYGERTSTEMSKEKESALQLVYAVPGGSSNVSITRKFSKPMDLRHYKTMNLWYNLRSFTGGEKIGIRIGSSDSDYVEYQFPMDYTKIWREVKIKLKSGSSGDVDVFQTEGNPDLKRVSMVKVIIYGSGSSGKIWLNDIYVSEPDSLESSAHWIEGEIKIKRPLFRTKGGVPILSDINIKYIQKGHGINFSTIGKDNSEIEEEYKQVFSSFKILPNWNAQIDFIREDSKTESQNEDVLESKRGKTERNSLYFLTDYKSNIYAVPSIKVTYKYDNYMNHADGYLTNYQYQVNTKTRNDEHSPAIMIDENIDKFLWGKFSTKLFINMLFKDEIIERFSSEENLASYTSIHEKETRQKTMTNFSMEYKNRIFYIKPLLSVSSEEIVELYGKKEIKDTEILSDVGGGFHFPFVYNKDFKFVERSKMATLSLGVNDFYISPQYKIETSYLENKFRDYSDEEELTSDKFRRAKNATSYISTKINIPVNLSKIKKVKFIKGINFSFSRSLYLYEKEIPYEGESSNSFKEEYGLSRSINSLLGGGWNIFSYYPGYFFTGRKNFSSGRDYIYGKLNDEITYPSGNAAAEYNNQLKLINNFSFNWTFDFDRFNFNTSTGLNQVSERMNINGVPQQVVSWNISTIFNFDMMKLFSFGFFRKNKSSLPHHAANVNLGYSYINNMIITSNIVENTHTPSIGITLKWDRSNIGLKTSVDFKKKNDKEFIEIDDENRPVSDNIYFTNMTESASFKETDIGYSFSIIYETDVRWIYGLFMDFYKLAALPIFSIEYILKLNRYDYNVTVSPEPYDLHLINGKLTLDLHRNIQGGIFSKFAFETFRNRETNKVSREIFSYQVGFNFSLIF